MKGIWVLIATLLFSACQTLPVIKPSPAHESKTACPSIFARSPIRYIHAIEARAAGKTQAVMIGVTLLNPGVRTISSAIVSAEGLSLFEATSAAGIVKVDRALPPFDAPDFAKNMMDDIELIFLAPRGEIKEKGRSADGRMVCRWHREKGGWVDISQAPDGRIRISRYSAGFRPERTVTLEPESGSPYAAIVLQAEGMIDYTLVMTLIESEAVPDSTDAGAADKTSEGKVP